MSAIVFDRVSKVYPKTTHPALDDVSLDFPSGETVVILGTSGAGKTTLLKAINRLIEPTQGRILIGGIEVHDLPVNDLRRRMGYVIQQVGLFPHWTVAQNVATVPRILGWEARRIEERVDTLLSQLSLPPAEFRGRYPSQLSGGQQQRVGLARALAADPEIMLMDEPFGAVDAITRATLQQEFLTLQSRTHKTVLFVTHDVDEALCLADRLVVMDQGKVLQYDTPFDVITRPATPFVAELLGADDIMRLLGLVVVRDVLRPLGVGGRGSGIGDRMIAPLQLDSSIREALVRLLQADQDALPVADAAGQIVGEVGLDTIRERLRKPSGRFTTEPVETLRS
jgi:osmoprotectant transport system ATP-binding protein